MNEVDRLTVIERKVYVCKVHGETKNVVGMGYGPPWCVECRGPVDVVRLVPDDQLKGAVEEIARLRGVIANAAFALEDVGDPLEVARALHSSGGSSGDR